jgi:DNA mismatch repair protein MSH3
LVGQCTPQELALLLSTFDRISRAYDRFEEPAAVGLNSRLLNHIIYSLPRLQSTVEALLSNLSLKGAKEGKKEEMWKDLDEYEDISATQLVCR